MFHEVFSVLDVRSFYNETILTCVDGEKSVLKNIRGKRVCIIADVTLIKLLVSSNLAQHDKKINYLVD